MYEIIFHISTTMYVTYFITYMNCGLDISLQCTYGTMLSLQQPLIRNARAHLWLQKQTDPRDREVVAVATSPKWWCKRRLDDDGLRLNSWREELRWTNTTQTTNLYTPQLFT